MITPRLSNLQPCAPARTALIQGRHGRCARLVAKAENEGGSASGMHLALPVPTPVLPTPPSRHRLTAPPPAAAGERGKSVESLFSKELQRRGIPNSLDEGDGAGSSGASPFAERRGPSAAPPRLSWDTVTEETPPQLKRSRELNSEGLEVCC
jgi:hypothetical protein